jgi:hypothetical protein
MGGAERARNRSIALYKYQFPFRRSRISSLGTSTLFSAKGIRFQKVCAGPRRSQGFLKTDTRAVNDAKRVSKNGYGLAQKSMSPMPPPMAPAPPLFSSGRSVTTASVVKNNAAIDAAFCNADRVTFAASITPAATRSS